LEKNKSMKKVMAFGTFDIFHEGHKSYLEQARELGDYLIVVVARDETVAKIKKQETKNKEQERLRSIKDSGLANDVIMGELEDKYVVIEKYCPETIALGYDQEVDLPKLTEWLKLHKLRVRIVRLKSYQPKKYKSSKLSK